jgi:hypothetical protein
MPNAVIEIDNVRRKRLLHSGLIYICGIATAGIIT